MLERLLFRESLTETFGRYAHRLLLASPAALFNLLFSRTSSPARNSVQTTQSAATSKL